MVRPHDDAESLELALIENMAREDLNPLEAARAVAVLVEELGLTREDIGRRVGRSRVAISNLLRLLELPDEALTLIEAGNALRGARSRVAHGTGSRRSASARSRRGGPRMVGASYREAGPGLGRTRGRESIKVARIESSAHPDELEAAERLGEAFAKAIGADVRVTPKAGGYRVEFAFASLEEALEAAERDRARRRRSDIRASSRSPGRGSGLAIIRATSAGD